MFQNGEVSMYNGVWIMFENLDISMTRDQYEVAQLETKILEEYARINGLEKMFLLPHGTKSWKVASNLHGEKIEVRTIFMTEIKINMGICTLSFTGCKDRESSILFLVMGE